MFLSTLNELKDNIVRAGLADKCTIEIPKIWTATQREVLLNLYCSNHTPVIPSHETLCSLVHEELKLALSEYIVRSSSEQKLGYIRIEITITNIKAK